MNSVISCSSLQDGLPTPLMITFRQCQLSCRCLPTFQRGTCFPAKSRVLQIARQSTHVSGMTTSCNGLEHEGYSWAPKSRTSLCCLRVLHQPQHPVRRHSNIGGCNPCKIWRKVLHNRNISFKAVLANHQSNLLSP